MLVRYVIGRPTVPKQPVRLKAGGVSRDLRRDTTRELYLRACEQEGVVPSPDYCEHLRSRDLTTWQYRLDMFAGPDYVRAALLDATQTQNAIVETIAKAQAEWQAPRRNAWHCERCSWRVHCEGDPLGEDLGQWHDVRDASKPSTVRVAYGRTKKALRRDRPGYCCSPSELRSFSLCPRLWWIEYHQRKRQGREGLKALPRLLGSLTHEALRLLTKNPAITLAREVQLIALELVCNGAIDAEAKAALLDPDQTQAIADRAAGMHALAMDGVAEVVEVEQRRAMVLPGTKKWLHGIPDAVVRLQDGRLAVIEYKTTSRDKDLSKTADRYRTNPAVHLYAALVQRGQLTGA